MKQLVEKYGEILATVISIVFCISIMVSGVFIGTSGLNAPGARGLAGAAAEKKDDDLVPERIGPELESIAVTPEDFQIVCKGQVVVDETIAVDKLFVAKKDETTSWPVSITQIKNEKGLDALTQGDAEISEQGVVLHSPGMYQFSVKVAPLGVTRSFYVFCKEREGEV